MFKLVFLFLAFLIIASSSASNQRQIRQIQLNDAQMIDTGPSNYALASDQLSSSSSSSQDGWNTISVNGDQITAWSTKGSECRSKQMKLDDLSEDDRTLVSDLRDTLNGVDGSSGSFKWSTTGQRTSYSSARFSLDGLGQSSSSSSSFSSGGGSGAMNSISMNGAQVTLNGDGNSFSISRPGLPDNLARLFCTDELTTFVYLDGTIQMKPTKCLNANEQQLVGQLRLEAREFRDNMRRFQIEFNRNMQDMGKNLNRNMEAMRLNLLNMNQNIRRNIMQGFQNNLIPTGYYGTPTRGGQYGVQPVAQDEDYQTDTNIGPSGGSYAPYGSGASSFGSNFPFGTPNRNPFGPGFPFYR